MNFLNKQQRFNAVLDKSDLKRVKIKQSDDSFTTKILLKCSIPLTNNIKKQLDARIQPLLNLKGTNGTAIDAVKIRGRQNCWCWIFDMHDFKSETKDARISIPDGDDGSAEITITGLALKDGDWYLKMEILAPYTDTLNTFSSRHCFGGDMALLIRPQQENLPLSGDANEEGSKDKALKTAKKKKSVKKKASSLKKKKAVKNEIKNYDDNIVPEEPEALGA